MSRGWGQQITLLQVFTASLLLWCFVVGFFAGKSISRLDVMQRHLSLKQSSFWTWSCPTQKAWRWNLMQQWVLELTWEAVLGKNSVTVKAAAWLTVRSYLLFAERTQIPNQRLLHWKSQNDQSIGRRFRDTARISWAVSGCVALEDWSVIGKSSFTKSRTLYVQIAYSLCPVMFIPLPYKILAFNLLIPSSPFLIAAPAF